MDRKKFFSRIRASLFGGSLSQPQVDGMDALLDALLKYKVTNPHHMANVMAQVYHETGRYMSPIKETVMPSHKDKNPSDATVISRLENAWKSGRLPWVETPYWRDGWFGRGPIMLTHRDNYDKMGKKLGVNLVANRDLALDPKVGAEIAVVGMRDGMFTGKKLSDYVFPAALDANWQNHPRRIVNGKDGTDADISRYHRAFYDAILDAVVQGRPEPFTPTPQPTQPQEEPIVRDPGDNIKFIIGAFIVLGVIAFAMFVL